MVDTTRALDIFKTIIVVILLIILLILISNFYNLNTQAELMKTEVPVSEQSAQAEMTPKATEVTPAVPVVQSKQSQIPECQKATPPRITGTGVKVKVVNALIPLRTKPAVFWSDFVLPLPVGTELEVMSLPVCAKYLNGANLWWGVRTSSGINGWAAEGSATKPTYYLEQIK
jgi:hypothetical protein